MDRISGSTDYETAPIIRRAETALKDSECPPELHEAAEHYAQAARAHNTKKAYTTDFAQFCAWCLPRNASSCSLIYIRSSEAGRGGAALEREDPVWCVCRG